MKKDIEYPESFRTVRGRFGDFLKEEDGIGVIELVLITVVLIGLVIIFKAQLTDLLESIFGEIESQSMEVY